MRTEAYAKLLLRGAIIISVIIVLYKSTPRCETWTASPTPQEHILIGNPTPEQAIEVQALLAEWAKKISSYGLRKGVDVDQRIRWQAVQKVLSNRQSAFSLYKASDSIYYWVELSAEGSLSAKLEECVERQRFVNLVANTLARSWGPKDPRSDRALQLKPQKLDNSARVSPIMHVDVAAFSAAGDVVTFSRKFARDVNRSSLPKINKESGTSIHAIPWTVVLVHELSHFVAAVVPGSGGHSIIFYMVMQDILRRLSAAKIISVRVLKDIEQPTDIAEIHNPFFYGNLIPGDPEDWPAIRKKVSEWKMQLDNNKNPAAQVAFRIFYDELGGGKGPGYTTMCRMFPTFCAYLNRTGFWRKPIHKRPFA